jgi:predicted AlkP superfamily pyrophosphatase or phosphodiesterase
MRKTILFLLAAPLWSWTAPASAHPVLMISIDGLRSKDVTEARAPSLPVFRKLMADGATADGVRDMLPSVTYPNHTTLVTGVAPALHGIAGNLTFDPLQKNMEGWYWYAEDVKVPSLFDAVHAKGGVTLGFGWPATAGSLSITDNIPEYWRAYTAEDAKVVRAVSTPGLAERINK